MSRAYKGAIRQRGEQTTKAPALATADVGALSAEQSTPNTGLEEQGATTETAPVIASTEPVVAALVGQDKQAAVVQIVMPGFTSIKYIGKRLEYVDGTYGTRLLFKQGESKWTPNDAAKKMLKHPDVYMPGDIPTDPAVKVAAKQGQKEDEDLQDLRDSIANMGKADLARYAKIHYGQDLSSELSVADTRLQVTMLVDQYGID